MRAIRKRRRYAFHMLPGHGPTVEGLLVGKSAREFVLIGAEVVRGPDDSERMGSEVVLLREHVFCMQEITS